MRIFKYISAALLLTLVACNPVPEIDDATMLDGDQIFDLSLTQPEKYLVSEYLPTPTEAQKDTPVIIAAHGYTATTFEWDELRDFADSARTFYVSQVLLGGHGRTYDDFKASDWKEWQSSIVNEYVKLHLLGFRNIFLAGSSTGAPLILQMFKSGMFANYTKPRGVFLIDPIVVSGNKTLTLVNLLGPVLGYTTVDLDANEAGKWYVYRPQETLKQLMALIDLTRKDLENGIRLTPGTELKVYKSSIDATADPVSAVLIHKGVRKSNGELTDVEMVDSKLHVFTRLRGRDSYTPKDIQLQQKAFKDMENRMTR